jgi:hypothetical protein
MTMTHTHLINLRDIVSQAGILFHSSNIFYNEMITLLQLDENFSLKVHINHAEDVCVAKTSISHPQELQGAIARKTAPCEDTCHLSE